MALTIIPVKGARSVSGTIREEFLDITLDASYPAGGYPVQPKDLNLSTNIFGVEEVGFSLANGAPPTAKRLLSFDFKNSKLQVFQEAGVVGPLAEVANTTNVSTLTFRVRAIGN